MTVTEATLRLSNTVRRRPSTPTRAAESHFRATEPDTPAGNGEDMAIPFVSPPPLITRVFPGL